MKNSSHPKAMQNASSYTILIFTLAFMLTGCQQTQEANTAEKQNVVLLFFDDMRYDVFGFTGADVYTPNIDALAEKGTRFASAMTTTGLCSPSRAVLFTGRWGHETGLDDNIQLWHSKNQGLAAEETSIQEWAMEAGINVGYYGKWHLGPINPAKRGIIHCDEDSFAKENKKSFVPDGRKKAVESYYNGEWKGGDKKEYWETTTETFKTSSLYQKTKKGLDFLDETGKNGEPFFLTISYNQPHPPYRVPEPFASMYSPESVPMPGSYGDDLNKKPMAQSQVFWPWHDVNHMSETDWRKAIAHYYGAVTMIDSAVGLVLSKLDEHKLAENTTVIVLGDQGSMMAEHGLYDKGPYSYDELMRIPIIIYSPGRKAGVINRQVSIMDLNKTMAELMGIESPVETHSRSLLTLIDKGEDAWEEENVAFYHYEWYNGSWFGIRTIRTPEWKFCWHPSDHDELYDLQNDPGEMENLADRKDLQELQKGLQQKLIIHMESTDDPLTGWLKGEMGL